MKVYMVDELIKLMQSGMSLHQARQELGLSRREAQRLSKEYNLEQYYVRGRPPKWGEADLLQAEAMLRDGASYREVARTTRVPRTTLREKFPGQGWTQEQALEFRRTLQMLRREVGGFN